MNFGWHGSSALERLMLAHTASGANDITTDTATGKIVNFQTSIKKNVGITFDLAPIQAGSGDPTPDNIRAISGHDGAVLHHRGKNMFNTVATSKEDAGVTYTVNNDGTITVSGTPSSWSGLELGTIDIPTSGKIVVSGLAETSNIQWDYIQLKTADGTDIANLATYNVFTTIINLDDYPTARKLRLIIKRGVNGTAVSGTVKPQVEFGSVPTSFEPYKGADYPITFPETVYGGTVDWNGNKVVSTMEIVDMGDLNWINTTTGYEGKNRFYAVLPKTAVTSDTSHVNSVCTCLKLVNSGATFSCVEGHTIAYSGNEWRVYAYVEAYSAYTKQQFKTAMEGQKLVYTPATPITYGALDCDPVKAYSGENTMWVNYSDSVTATYKRKLIPETGYTHENVTKIRINGNEYAFGNASVANRKNYAVITQNTASGGGVTVEEHRNIVVVNGTSSGVNDMFLNAELVDIPAGTYKAIVTPYMGQSAVVTGKNMYMDFWYDLASDYAVRATFSGVKDSTVETTVTFTSPVVRMRAIVGVRGVKYDDYRLCYELFPSDVSFTDIGSPVPADGHIDYTFGTEQSFVDSRMHTSTIKK